MNRGVLFLYLDAKSVQRNEEYESFSTACYQIGAILDRTSRLYNCQVFRFLMADGYYIVHGIQTGIIEYK